MKTTSLFSCVTALFAATALAKTFTSNSLIPCDGFNNTLFSADLFQIDLFADNGTLSYNVNAFVSISEKVSLQMVVQAYGYQILNKTFDPCSDSTLAQLCPLSPGPLPLAGVVPISQSDIAQIPGIAYYIPDIDAVANAYIVSLEGQVLGCLQATLSNGKTVDLTGVKVVLALLTILFLAVSGGFSVFGYSSTATHLMGATLSMFGFFQAQALWGLISVPFPPLVQSWTQDFQWSLGLVEIPFMQNAIVWYQRATGGTPSTLMNSESVASVALEKRDASIAATNGTILRGIERAAFTEGIEPSNIFATSFGIFLVVSVIIVLLFLVYRLVVELISSKEKGENERTQDFKDNWLMNLRGTLFRTILAFYPLLATMCLWELYAQDSAGEVATAVLYLIIATGSLGMAAFLITRLARKSIHAHNNPAVGMYNNSVALNKWSFLYTQYRATAYYFLAVQVAYILVKAILIVFLQNVDLALAIAILVLEVAWLITISTLRPFMSKKMNTMNITIAVMNFLCGISNVIFTNVFHAPGLLIGIVGVIIVLINLVYAGVLVITMLIATVWALFSKNPDAGYQSLEDDRTSFMKPGMMQSNVELDEFTNAVRANNKLPMTQSTTDLFNAMPKQDEKQAFSQAQLLKETEAGSTPMQPQTQMRTQAPTFPQQEMRSQSPSQFNGATQPNPNQQFNRPQGPFHPGPGQQFGRPQSPYSPGAGQQFGRPQSPYSPGANQQMNRANSPFQPNANRPPNRSPGPLSPGMNPQMSRGPGGMSPNPHQQLGRNLTGRPPMANQQYYGNQPGLSPSNANQQFNKSPGFGPQGPNPQYNGMQRPGRSPQQQQFPPQQRQYYNSQQQQQQQQNYQRPDLTRVRSRDNLLGNNQDAGYRGGGWTQPGR